MAFIAIFHEYIADFDPINSESAREYELFCGCLVVSQHCLGDG